MKKIVYSLLIAGLLWGSEAAAQFSPVPYTAKTTGAINAVRNRAQQDGFTNPEIVGVGTFKGDFPISSFTVENRFDLGNETNAQQDADRGKAQVWAYMVRSAAMGDSTKLYLAANVAIFLVFDAPAGTNLSSLPATFTKALPANWINSDEAVVALRGNSTYMQFRQDLPDSTPNFAAIGYSNEAIGNFAADTPLWTLIFQGSGTSFMACYVHATTKATECVRGTPVPVEEGSQAGSLASPNPARDFVRISIPEQDYSPEARLDIYSSLGERVFSFNMSEYAPGYTLSVPVDKLPDGIYHARYSGSSRMRNFSFVVEK